MINMCVCAQVCVCGRVCFCSRFQQTVNHLQVWEANLQSRWPSRLPGCPLKRSGLWTEPSPSLSTDQAKKQNRNHGSYSHLSTSSLWCAAPAEAAAHESMRQLQHLWITLASWMGSGLLQGVGGHGLCMRQCSSVSIHRQSLATVPLCCHEKEGGSKNFINVEKLVRNTPEVGGKMDIKTEASTQDLNYRR